MPDRVGFRSFSGRHAILGFAHRTCVVLRGQRLRKERPRRLLVAPPWHRQTLLAAGPAIDERLQERKIVREIFEHALEIAFEAGNPRPCVGRR
jgi:hypothetical protein